MRAIVLKGGWFWLGVRREAGDVLDAPSAEWIANQGRNVAAIDEPPVKAAPESAAIAPTETAAMPTPKPRKR